MAARVVAPPKRPRAAWPVAFARLRPSPRHWLALSGLVVPSAVLDFRTLVLITTAVGATIPVKVLIAGFLIVQGSIALQIFPGEPVGLLGLLIASGVPIALATASTLLYRAISWPALAVAGWVVYLPRIRLGPLHEHRHAPEHALG